MSEETTKEITATKMSSRKFIVWLVWLVITLLYTVFIICYSIATKQVPESFIDFLELLVKYFFVISCIYLGVNVVGKGVAAAKDILTSAETVVEETNVEESK